MEPSPLLLLAVAAVLFLGGLIQSTIGFAFGLFAIPSLVWLGVPLPAAIATVTAAVITQTLVGVRALRREIDWKIVALASVTRLVTILLGVLLLVQLSYLSTEDIKFVVGCFMALVVISQWVARPQQRERIPLAWSMLAFSVSGFLAGIVGMGGPALVIWAMAHDWSSDKIRGHLFTLFALTLPFQILLLGIFFGKEVVWALIVGLLMAPVVYLGSVIGLRWGNRLDRHRLRHIAYGVLLLMAAVSMYPRLAQWWVS